MNTNGNGPDVDLVADVQASLALVAALCAEHKARSAQALWSQVLAIQEQVASIRAAGVQEMRARGDSLAYIGEVLGLSISRVKQLEDRIERPSRTSGKSSPAKPAARSKQPATAGRSPKKKGGPPTGIGR